MALPELLTQVAPPAADFYVAALARSDDQAKPPGSLGRLEELSAWISACQGKCPPDALTNVRAVVFAGDHGVSDYGVSAYPAAITQQMTVGIAVGAAGVNALARSVGVNVRVVDIGVAVDVDGLDPEVARHKVTYGTRPLHLEDALTPEETERALLAGDEIAADEIAAGAQMLISGDLGIGNTTAASALIASSLRLSGEQVCGRGSGVSEEALAKKVEIVDQALNRVGDVSPLRRLAALGSSDMAAAVGFMIGAARRGVPVVVDGVIASSEALMAEQLAPDVRLWMRAGHRSTEPAIGFALDALGLEPIVDLRMRLGEGTGAVMAVPTIRAAVGALRDIALLSDVTGGNP